MFRQALHLSPGTYWLGLLTGGDSGVAGVLVFPSRDSAPANTNVFAAGPSNPFGPIASVANAQMTLLLHYQLAPEERDGRSAAYRTRHALLPDASVNAVTPSRATAGRPGSARSRHVRESVSR